ncbi:hypothetical protein BJV74DRAFT_788663 [Russula compacta]|nr:hypothetical protein BJV74DRAFT_788663 [Russula compacta]
MPLPPYDVYRDQLTSLYYGHALWDPDPSNVYNKVSVGDMGYVKEGCFYRMFNVLLEWDDPLNRILCEPEPYTRLDLGPFINTRVSRFSKGDYPSRHVTSTSDMANTMAADPDDSAGTTYKCRKRQGAFLTLPHDGTREDVIRTKVFEDYIRDHVESWFTFAQRQGYVERMEELILVSGCTLVTSWGVAAFVDSINDAEISLRSQAYGGGGASFDWREIGPGVAYQDSSHQGAVRSLGHLAASFTDPFFARLKG